METCIVEAVQWYGNMAIVEAMGMDRRMAIDEAVRLEWSMGIGLDVIRGQTKRIRTASTD